MASDKNKLLSPAKFSWAPALVLALVSFVVYANTLKHGYAQDDTIVITQNKFTKLGFAGISEHMKNDAFTGFFGTDQALVAGGRYRPLSFVTFCIEEELFNNGPIDEPAQQSTIYLEQSNPSLPGIRHFVNVLLFSLTTVVLWLTLASILGTGKHKWLNAAFLSSLLFAVHPIHTEVVANIKGRDEIMVLLFSLLTLYTALKMAPAEENKREEKISFLNAGLIFIYFFLALLSKENAVTFLAIVPLALYYFRKPRMNDYILSIAPMLLAFGVFFLMRMGATANTAAPAQATANVEILNDPWAGVAFGDRFGTIGLTFGKYLQLLFIPHPLTHDYYPWQISITPVSSPAGFVPVLLGLVLLGYALWQLPKKSPASFGILFFFLTFSVVSNLFISVGTLMGERFVFMSSVGFCLAVGWGIFHLAEKIKTESTRTSFLWALMIIPAAGYSVKTILRNPAWENDFTLFTTDVKTSTNSTKCNTSAGGALYEAAIKQGVSAAEKNTMLDQSLVYLDKALAIYPANHNASLLKGNVLNELGRDYEKALDCYDDVVRKIPKHKVALKNGIATANKSNNIKLISRAYRKYLATYPTEMIMWHDLAIEFRDANLLDSAVYTLNYAVQQDPKLGIAWTELGTIYGQRLNKLDEAKVYFQKAIDAGYSSEILYENYGIAHAFSNNLPEALRLFLEGARRYPNSTKLAMDVLTTYSKMGDQQNTANWEQKCRSMGINLGQPQGQPPQPR